MGTRSLTVFTDGTEEIAVLYRQFDGYPSGHGKELAEYLKGGLMVNGFSLGEKRKVFNGMGDLAVRVIAALKRKQGDFHPEVTPTVEQPGNLYLHPAKTRDVGEEYVYYVSSPEHTGIGFADKAEIMLRVCEVLGGYSGEPREERELFTGNPAEYLKWLKAEEKRKAAEEKASKAARKVASK